MWSGLRSPWDRPVHIAAASVPILLSYTLGCILHSMTVDLRHTCTQKRPETRCGAAFLGGPSSLWWPKMGVRSAKPGSDSFPKGCAKTVSCVILVFSRYRFAEGGSRRGRWKKEAILEQYVHRHVILRYSTGQTRGLHGRNRSTLTISSAQMKHQIMSEVTPRYASTRRMSRCKNDTNPYMVTCFCLL